MRQYEREIIYRPYCANARRSWWLAWFSLMVCVVNGLLLRYELIEPGDAFIVFASAMAVAGLALILALAAFRRIWREDDRGVGRALVGFFVALLLIGTPFAMHVYVLAVPGSAHISTDIAELPPFSRTGAAFAFRGGGVPATPSRLLLARQVEDSPDTVSLIVDTEALNLFQQVQEIARDEGWTVTATVAPEGRFGDGHVDMAARTLLFRLPVDMTVRIRPTAEGTRVDVRCASRYPYFDFSGNVSLVRSLLREIAKGPPLG